MLLVWPERGDASGPVVPTDRGAFHEADDPYDIIDVYWSLRCLDKSLRVCIGHKPKPALSLPSCVGANFATKFDQHVVPLEMVRTASAEPLETNELYGVGKSGCNRQVRLAPPVTF